MSEPQIKTSSAPKGRILAVEDEATSLAILVTLLEELGYEVLEAENGREALDIVDREAGALDVIVLDKAMPEMNGLEVVAALKEELKAQHIPVVMVTGSTKPEEVKEGIDAGVFYYMTKPYEEGVFKSVISSAMSEANRRSTLKAELKKHQTSFSFINKAEFEIHTMDEAEDLACFLANCFPDPDKTLPGLASLLINAVEHGNFEIGYGLKTKLLEKGTWRQEIDRRAELPEYKDRIVRADLTRTDDETKVVIEDQGKGFDWTQYMDIDPARALDTHGRGIAQANKISFDEVRYEGAGNKVTAISKKESGIDW